MSAPFRRAARHRPAATREHAERTERQAELASIRTDVHFIRWLRHL